MNKILAKLQALLKERKKHEEEAGKKDAEMTDKLRKMEEDKERGIPGGDRFAAVPLGARLHVNDCSFFLRKTE